MKLEALVSNIAEYGNLKETIALYPDANYVKKYIIEEAIVRYMIALDVNMKDIEDQLPKYLKGELYARRQIAFDEDDRMRAFALEEIIAPLSDENKARLA